MKQSHHALAVFWPAFLAACALEWLVFGWVDPSDLHTVTQQGFDWPRQMVYTMAFFAFWAIAALACHLSLLLARSSRQPPVP